MGSTVTPGRYLMTQDGSFGTDIDGSIYRYIKDDYDPGTGYTFDDNLDDYTDNTIGFTEDSSALTLTYSSDAFSSGKALYFPPPVLYNNDPYSYQSTQYAYAYSEDSNILDMFTGTDDWSVVIWFKRENALKQDSDIFRIGPKSTLYDDAVDGIRFGITGAALTGTAHRFYCGITEGGIFDEIWSFNTGITDNIWNFAAYGRSGGSYFVNFNGSNIATGGTTDSINPEIMELGGRAKYKVTTQPSAYLYFPFNGWISGLKMYGKKLTETECSELYRLGI